jgi:hypothetical protein
MTNRGQYVRIGNRTWFPFNGGDVEDDGNDDIRNFGDEEDFDLVVGEEQYLDPESLDANNLGANLGDAARSREEQDFLGAFESGQNAHLDETYRADDPDAGSGWGGLCAIM